MKHCYLNIEELAIGHKSPLSSGINLSLGAGEILYIQGTNGSGKTTLIKTILGAIPKISGSYNWTIPKYAISYLPQITNPNTNFSYTIGEIHDLYEAMDSSNELITDSLRKKRWINASGGEKQKVMILTRLTKNTKVLILDEPFNHLDKDSIKIVSDLLIKVSTVLGISIILVSHHVIDIPENRLKVLEVKRHD
ncbi:hydrolase, P-loop-like family protein [Bacteriovorax sp. BAL6_X]|uniref:ATP-binding cassette domain-containing protein n=1 Tax=Bacteriovorax sp. BAL6_X TaxID=1201290 RepID=UPI0003857235|nr:ABC transporter ATP-binding protein [Bacteriovorax sp. BAL6_X]EPZ49238.1 hydrolase, P-loop-like family protein [Bacteriovorax sp. BAL6_X]